MVAYVTCSRCKQKKAERKRKYFGGVFCAKCLDWIRDRIKNGKMINFRGIFKAEVK